MVAEIKKLFKKNPERKYKLVKVPELKRDEMFKEFFETSAFTFEGIVINDELDELEKFLEARDYNVPEEKRYWYWFTGEDMNYIFGLTDDNAYPNDLTFLVIPEYYNPMTKIQIGARWFDDIVANNTIRQREINKKRMQA